MDMHCKDYSDHCMTISANSCRMLILADACKRSCGLCNSEQSHGLPPLPLHLRGKPLHTSLLLHGRNFIPNDINCFQLYRSFLYKYAKSVWMLSKEWKLAPNMRM